MSEMYRAERSRRLAAEREARELRYMVRRLEREIRGMRTDRAAVEQGLSPWVHLPFYGFVN